MLCGMTLGDYIRQRRLSAAGLEVLTTDRKIIDIALEFGYDSPDSFTKAFTRFHGGLHPEFKGQCPGGAFGIYFSHIVLHSACKIRFGRPG